MNLKSLAHLRSTNRISEEEHISKWYDDLRMGDHAAHIYQSDAEEIKVVLDLIKWLGPNDKFVYLSDKWGLDDSSSRSVHMHPVLVAAAKEGRFEVLSARSALYSMGKLRPNAITDLMAHEQAKALQEGYNALLMGWDGTWACSIEDGLEPFLLCETHLNMSRFPKNLTAFCQYDGRKMVPEQSAKVSSMHQLVLKEGKLNRNYWVISTGGPEERPVTSKTSARRGQALVEQNK